VLTIAPGRRCVAVGQQAAVRAICMTDLIERSSSRQATDGRSRPRRVTGALQKACDLMVFGDAEGQVLEFDEAARAAGLTVRAMRLALGKSHVRQYLKSQRSLLIASLSANNVAHLARLRGHSSNQMVRLQASRTIEELAGGIEPTLGPRARAPGVVIVIGAPPTVTIPQHTGPLIDIDGSREE
jgi:hypothetical protein